MKRDCYPLVVNLPDGKRAQYVDGSRPARYTVDGEPTAIDVTIPDELAQAGWYWSGSFLYQPWPEPRTEEQGRGPGVAISTGTFGPPGYPCDRQTCFEAAYELEAKRVELQAQPKKQAKPKKERSAPMVAELEPAQMELAL